MNIVGISCFYHESAASLVVDGKIVAAIAQERLSRKKHDAGYPKQAIDRCLALGHIKPGDIDYVVLYERPFIKFERNIMIALAYFPHTLGWFVESMRNALTEKLWIRSTIASHLGVSNERILFVPQHIAHAAASFYPSPFRDAAVLTLDGVGEWTTGSMGEAHSNRLTLHKELRFPHSVGLLYSTFTAFLGFEVNDGEYKVMGMAAYGKPKHVNKIKKVYTQTADGGLALDLSYFSFHRSVRRMYTDKFVELFRTCNRFDLAASIQMVTEEIVLNMVKELARITGKTNLVYGGGVALNSVINAAIRKKTLFKNVFIFPAAGDDGASVGAALYVYHHILGNKKRKPLSDMFLGTAYKAASVKQFLDTQAIVYTKMSPARLIPYIVEALTRGKVVGWFEGRSEFGPRALGHRSILADPRKPSMKDIVNSKIKFREEFRPFAPVVLASQAKQYYPESDTLMSPFMLATYKASAKAKRHSAATVHEDDTSRIQTVDSKYPGLYAKLLQSFYRKTGRGVLLNTSFNLKGEPIVETPADAYSTFMRSGIDILVMEGYVILKKS